MSSKQVHDNNKPWLLPLANPDDIYDFDSTGIVAGIGNVPREPFLFITDAYASLPKTVQSVPSFDEYDLIIVDSVFRDWSKAMQLNKCELCTL